MDNKDPYIYRIREIHKVVDGDTIDADIDRISIYYFMNLTNSVNIGIFIIH